jgi:NAD+ kinase
LKIVGLLTRPDFKSGVQFSQQILAYLETKKRTVVIPPHLAKALKRPELARPIKEMKADVVITLGGDGTTLYAAQHLPSDIPLLPVNLESFGFLSECEIQEVEDLLDQESG